MRAASRLSTLGLAVLVGSADFAEPSAIKVLCSTALKTVMVELAPRFERTTKHRVEARFGLGAALKQQIEAGEAFDMAILTPGLIDDLIKQGKIATGTRTSIARSGLGLAIRAGSARPDIGSLEKFKGVLEGARSISYAKEGASGVYFSTLIERLGIAERLRSTTRLAVTGDEVGQAVARGETELGVLPVSEILPVPGIELLGSFPPGAQGYIEMIGGVSISAKQGDAAKELIKFLTSPSVRPVVEAKGMEVVISPARPR